MSPVGPFERDAGAGDDLEGEEQAELHAGSSIRKSLRRRLAGVVPPVPGAGGEVEALAPSDPERRGAVVELVLDLALEHVTAVAVGAPLLPGCARLVLDDRPALAEGVLRARVDVRLVVRPVDRLEVDAAAGAHTVRRLERDDVLAGVHEVLVLDQEAGDPALRIAHDLVEALHDLDQSDDVAGLHLVALVDVRIGLRVRPPVERPGQRRLDRSLHQLLSRLDSPRLSVERALGVDRLVDRHLAEADGVAHRAKLADLPEVGVDDRRRDDEPSGRRAVRPEDHRQVAVDVDRAHGVAVVEDVRRVPAGDAAALARPFEPVRFEPDPGAVRVPVDRPLAAEQRLHVRLGEEVRRRVRSAHRPDLPLPRVGGDRVFPEAAPGHVAVRLSDRQAVALLQRPALVAAERAHRVRRARAEQLRHVEAAGDREIEAEPAHGRDADRDLGARRHAMTLPEGDLLAADREGRLCAADRHGRLLVEADPEVAESDLERRGGLRIAHEQVRGAVGEMIHRPCREEALREHPAPARVVLDGRLEPALDDLARPHGTGVAAAAASRRCRRSSASSAIVGSQSRKAPTSNGLSSMRYR